MARRNRPDIKFLEIQVEQARDEARQVREAANVLSSYSHALDFLAEALQNATDAIDERRAGEPDAPGQIVITFDVPRRRFSVADTGTGMREQDVTIVLTPNVTTKAGRFARSGRRSRGEKGVGLSFLALGSNYLHIRTCDGSERHDVTVTGGRDWVLTDGDTETPVGKHIADDPDRYLGSPRYTVVTVGGIDAEEFDRDLFGYEEDELVWALRTQTAIGNTRYLFEKPFSRGRYENEIAVQLSYIGPDRIKRELRPVPYSYATPEELAPCRPIVEFEDVANLPPDQQVLRLRGAAVRYVKRFRTPSGRVVAIYAYITDGDEMRVILRNRKRRRGWAPQNWQGFLIATRDMPTGVPLGVSVIPTRGYERRMFVLIQEDALLLDLGRKTLHGQTRNMLADVVRRAWRRDLQKVVPRVGAEKEEGEIDRAALDLAIARSRRRRDLRAPIPYLKTPDSRAALVAIFHELIAADHHAIPRMRTLDTGIFLNEDSLMFPGEPNGTAPLHVLFAVNAVDLVREIEARGSIARTADLAVVWDLTAGALSERGVAVEVVDSGSDGATHVLLLHGVAGLNQLRIIALGNVLQADT